MIFKKASDLIPAVTKEIMPLPMSERRRMGGADIGQDKVY